MNNSHVTTVNYDRQLGEERIPLRADTRADELRGFEELVVSSTCIRSMYDRWSSARAATGRCHRRQLRPERTQIYRRQTCCVQTRHDAAVYNDALGCTSRLINACTRRSRSLPSWRGRTESASGISLGSTDAPTARFWTNKMESNAPYDESGWIDGNADHADHGKERKRKTRTAGARMEPGRYFHSQRITARVCRFWVANAAHTHRTWDMGEMWSYREPLLGKTEEWIWKLKEINDSLSVSVLLNHLS